jgi:hypothetical protein
MIAKQLASAEPCSMDDIEKLTASTARMRLTCKMSMNTCKSNEHMQPQSIRERLKSGGICKVEQNLSLIEKCQNVLGSSGQPHKNESLPSKTMLSFVDALKLTVERAREVETERQNFWPP